MDPWSEIDRPAWDELVAAEAPREPGGRIRYSSLGVGLLGDALAARAGLAWHELLTERILRPLGMESTYAEVPPEEGDRLTGGHSRRGRPRPPIQDFMPAAGSLRSSAADMLRFLEACLRPPEARPGPALALAQRPRARMGRGGQIGLCWMIATRRGRPPVTWHNGGTWGFRSVAALAPGSQTAAVVLANSTAGVDRLGLDLVEGR